MTDQNRAKKVDIFVGMSIVSIFTITVGAGINDTSLVIFGAALAAAVIVGVTFP